MNEPHITELVAICLLDPDGDNGLEGYTRGEAYRCHRVEGNWPAHYRIFPGEAAPDRYQCVTPRVFSRYFRTETPGMHVLLTSYQSRRNSCSPA